MSQIERTSRSRLRQMSRGSSPTADILFVIDDSGSMAPEQANLAQNFQAFIDTLAQTQRDRAAIGLDPLHIWHSIADLITRIWDMGWDAVVWLWRYFLLGAVIVLPIWVVVRLAKGGRP